MITFYADNHATDALDNLKKYSPKSDGDLLILLGDTAYRLGNLEKHRIFDKWLLSQTYGIAIVDGNHENFELYLSLPKKEMYGGTVDVIKDNIVRFHRGEIYTIENNRFFVFGGCASGAKWKAQGLWHPGDLPSDDEIARGYKALAEADFNVDYVLTHKYFGDDCLVFPGQEEYRLFLLNRFIDGNVAFKRWFSGHRHEDREYDSTHRIIYDKLVELY